MSELEFYKYILDKVENFDFGELHKRMYNNEKYCENSVIELLSTSLYYLEKKHNSKDDLLKSYINSKKIWDRNTDKSELLYFLLKCKELSTKK